MKIHVGAKSRGRGRGKQSLRRASIPRKAKATHKADPDATVFNRDSNERAGGDCFPDMLIAVCTALFWYYPDEFLPDWTYPTTVKQMRMWLVTQLREQQLIFLEKISLI
jgi:hypothetical protein